MAHFVAPFRPDWRQPQNAAESQACEYVAKVFGRQPCSVRRVAPDDGPADVCLVKLDWGQADGCEFLCAGGFMIGLPRKA
jgi:hypothetical protein